MSVFMLMLVIGIAVPGASLALSALFGGLDGLLHLAHFDGAGDFAHEASCGDAGLSFVPASPLLWCSMLVATGSVGESLTRLSGLNPEAVWLIALPAGYAVMLLLHNGLVLPMKRAKNFASDLNDIIGQTAPVIEAIPEGGLGAVQVTGRSGRAIYAARSADQGRFEQGAEVRIVDFSGSRAVVAAIGGLDSGGNKDNKVEGEFENG
ncbi:MAG: NfeD family protein [Clostridiales bacterium]|jgi:membrane protein implicated in regulation of membrane protease activity|nr:NfeD family protein [Clostridiales bacterium]